MVRCAGREETAGDQMVGDVFCDIESGVQPHASVLGENCHPYDVAQMCEGYEFLLHLVEDIAWDFDIVGEVVLRKDHNLHVVAHVSVQ